MTRYEDESGMPIHLPMGVNAKGQGPVEPNTPHHYVCWCGRPGCVWNIAFANQTWLAKNTPVVEHLPIRGPGYWEWRCLKCGEEVSLHPGLFKLLWRKLTLRRNS